MNYNLFTKAELIEAIEASDISFDIDFKLNAIWDRKTGAILERIEQINAEMELAIKNKAPKKFYELHKELNTLNKKLDRLYKL